MKSLKFGNLRIGSGSRGGTELIPIPAGFVHPMGTFVVTRKSGVATITSHTIDSFRTTYASPIVKYVDWQNGLDTNTGNSWEQAYKTISKLVSVTFNRAYFAPGNYSNSVAANVFTQSREVFGYGGKAAFMWGGTGDSFTWTDIGSGAFSCSTTLTPVMVVDSNLTNAYGDPLQMVLVASSAAVQSTANSYYYDSVGDVLYVHLTSGLTPNNNFFFTASSITVTNGTTVYAENCRFYGMSSVNSTATQTKILLNNCIIGPSNGQGIVCNGNSFLWIKNSQCLGTKVDGISYSIATTYNPCGVEENLTTRYNGVGYSIAADGTLNGSTTHNSSIVLRINGDYQLSNGPCVADSASSKTLNISCIAGNSLSIGLAITKSAFTSSVGASQPTEMWLDGCRNVGADTYGAVTVDTTNAKIYTRKCTLTNVEPNTVLTPY